MATDQLILKFFREDIGGLLITNAQGDTIFSDKKMAFISQEKTNWKYACPPPRPGQRAEPWDLLRVKTGQTYMVISSTFSQNGELLQLHHLVDISMYIDLYRDITDYSQMLKAQKDHDGLTGLYNKGRFMELKRTLYNGQSAIAVYNLDVNNLKYMNDTFGHEMGDKLIVKAANSMKAIESRNVTAFRVGGDEFIVVAIHITREEAEKIREAWEAALAELNRMEDGIHCVIACGWAYGEGGYDFDELLALADQRMYEDKREKKKRMTLPEAPRS